MYTSFPKTNITRQIFGPLLYSTNDDRGLRFPVVLPEKTTFELIKELRSGWRAFWFNNTASLFDISLKKKFDPYNEKEDYLIEDILQRSFSDNSLEKQDYALDFDLDALYRFWRDKN